MNRWKIKGFIQILCNCLKILEQLRIMKNYTWKNLEISGNPLKKFAEFKANQF